MIFVLLLYNCRFTSVLCVLQIRLMRTWSSPCRRTWPVWLPVSSFRSGSEDDSSSVFFYSILFTWYCHEPFVLIYPVVFSRYLAMIYYFVPSYSFLLIRYNYFALHRDGPVRFLVRVPFTFFCFTPLNHVPVPVRSLRCGFFLSDLRCFSFLSGLQTIYSIVSDYRNVRTIERTWI